MNTTIHLLLYLMRPKVSPAVWRWAQEYTACNSVISAVAVAHLYWTGTAFPNEFFLLTQQANGTTIIFRNAIYNNDFRSSFIIIHLLHHLLI